MEELKPHLLPCNLEQLNERVLNLGEGIAQMGEQDAIRVHKEFLTAVLGYMEELLGMRREEESRRAAPENKPLSLEQLRQMDGEPVYLVYPNSSEMNGWEILKGIDEEPDDDGDMGALFSDEGWEGLEEYGKGWLAYARHPEPAP